MCIFWIISPIPVTLCISNLVHYFVLAIPQNRHIVCLKRAWPRSGDMWKILGHSKQDYGVRNLETCCAQSPNNMQTSHATGLDVCARLIGIKSTVPPPQLRPHHTECTVAVKPNSVYPPHFHFHFLVIQRYFKELTALVC